MLNLLSTFGAVLVWFGTTTTWFECFKTDLLVENIYMLLRRHLKEFDVACHKIIREALKHECWVKWHIVLLLLADTRRHRDDPAPGISWVAGHSRPAAHLISCWIHPRQLVQFILFAGAGYRR